MNTAQRLDYALKRVISEDVPFRVALEQAIAGAFMDGVREGRSKTHEEIRADLDKPDGRLGRVFDAVAVATIERCARVVMERLDFTEASRASLAVSIRREMDRYA